MKNLPLPLLAGTVVVLGIVLAALAYVVPAALSNVGTGGQACTTEAKLCPDGSAVGRTGPNCEFAACPEATSTGTTGGAPVAGAGEHCGGFIQNAPVCGAGYHCQLKINMPDTGGTCVANSAGGGFAEYHSGVRGTVLLGPTCPVMRNPPDPQCADRPYQTTVVVFRASDTAHSIASVQSAADGTFQISLPPGDYVVGAEGGSMLPRCANTTATVGPTGYTSVNISCDTGIR